MLLDHAESLVVVVDVQDKLVPALIEHDLLIRHCARILQLANHLEIPILVCEQYPEKLGTTVSLLQPFITAAPIVAKVHFSLCDDANGAQHLQQFKKKQIILIGIEAHVCILQTALSLIKQHFDVYVVVEAIACRGEHNLNYSLARMQAAGVQLITAEMLFFEWLNHSKHPLFKQLSREFLTTEV